MKSINLRSLFGVVAWFALLLAMLLRCQLVFHWEGGSDEWGPSFYLQFRVLGRSLIDIDVPRPSPPA